MYPRNVTDPIILHDAVSLLTANFTAATTDIVTSNAHGLIEGDRVRLTTTTTLPAGLSLLTDSYVFAVTTNTFKLTLTPIIRRASTDPMAGLTQYATIDITDTGTGTHTFTIASTSIPQLVPDWRHLKIGVNSAGAASGDDFAITMKTSDEKDAPDFAQAKSATNVWAEVQVINANTAATIDGTTTIANASGSNLHAIYAVNQDLGRWICADITAMDDVTNTVTVKLLASSN